MTLASTAKPSPLTKPASMQARTTASNTWRKRSLSRKRPCRLTENVEWSGTASSRSRRQNQRQLDLLAQSPLEADAVAVADQQHPEHEFGIDRRTADCAIEGRQLLAQIGQHPRHNRIHPTQQMAFQNALFEVEQVEQLALIARLLPHHRESPSLVSQADGITVRQFSRALFQQHRSNPVLRVLPLHVRLGAASRIRSGAVRSRTRANSGHHGPPRR